MLIHDLEQKKIIQPPSWLADNTHLVVRIGGKMYGYSDPDGDNDLYGIVVPPKNLVFPHLTGEIQGFGRQHQRFEQWQQHGIEDKDSGDKFDFSVYSIVKFFNLCMENNPNFLTVLFVPQNHVLHITQIGQLIRDNRKMFLHRGCFPKYKGYSFSQIHKMRIKNPNETSNRQKYVQAYGYDVKFALHCVRLLLECEQILTTGDLDVQRDVEQLKAIKRGEWKEQDVYDWFASKEKDLEKMYAESKLPWGPDEEKIKSLLLECLRIQYENIDDCVVNPNASMTALNEIKVIIDRYASLF